MRIIFIRHGEPDYEKDDLTKTGYIQAEQVAERLKDEGIDEIWSSTHGRALNTAKYTAELLGLPIKKADFIREITWGSANGEKIFAGGHPWDIADEMARRGMDLNDPAWRANPFFANKWFRFWQYKKAPSAMPSHRKDRDERSRGTTLIARRSAGNVQAAFLSINA